MKAVKLLAECKYNQIPMIHIIMGLSRTHYNKLAKTTEKRKGPEYQGSEMDKDLQNKGPEMEEDLKCYGPVESKISMQDMKQKTKVNTTAELES